MKRHFSIAVFILVLAAICFGSPTQHQASLSWSQSTGSSLTGNCVYRSTTSGGPYTQIFCSTSPITSYIDTTVLGGTTYYYVVTAVAGTQESAYSNESKAVIPQSPPAPSGLTAVGQ